jgi:C-terminal processing protease CtpA/Prc
MKNFLLLAFALILGGSLMAQDPDKKVIVIKKNKDGSITKIEKAVKEEDDTVIYIREAAEKGEKAEAIHIKMKELEEKLHQLKEGGELKKLKELNGELHELKEMQFMYGRSLNEHRDNQRLIPEKAEKAFLGVVAGEADGNIGFRVSRVVEGSGAEAGGLQGGDVVLSINNAPTNGSYGLTGVLARHQPNDQVRLDILRDGRPMSLDVTLTGREYTRHVLNDERDPCDVFIGVYTTDFSAQQGEGVRVTSIIGNTPAEMYGVQAGDIILSLDGVDVTTGNQLRSERDKHEPGEEFTLLVNRNGDYIDINAQFKTCAEPREDEVAEEPVTPAEQPALAPVEEKPEPLVQPRELPTLELEQWQAFPNPSLGDITIEFKAEPVPTNIRVLDASGKVIYQEQLNNFDGLYKKELNLRKATPGTLLLSIQQGDKVVTKQLVLMNRA